MWRGALAAVVVWAVLTGCGDVGPRVAGTQERAAGSWERLPDPPLSPRSDAVVVGVGDRAVVVGGWELLCPPAADCAFPDAPLLRDGAVHDLTTGAWTAMAAAPHGLRRGERATAVVGDSAFVLSSCAGGPECTGRPRLLEYDVSADRWTDHGSPPVASGTHVSLLAAGARLVVLSASDERGERSDALYDPATGGWETLPDDPLPEVFDRTGVVVDGNLVVAGSVIADVDAGDEPRKPVARLDLARLRWTPLPEAPGQGYQLFPTEAGPLLNGHFIDAPGWLLDPATWTWRGLPEQSGDQHDLRGVLGRDGATYEVPNSVGRMTVQQRVFLYDSAADEYVLLPPLAERQHVHGDSSTAVGRSLFVFGGSSWPDDGMTGGELVRDPWLWTPPPTDESRP